MAQTVKDGLIGQEPVRFVAPDHAEPLADAENGEEAAQRGNMKAEVDDDKIGIRAEIDGDPRGFVLHGPKLLITP